MYEMLYGINGVSHFYGIHMEYVWNMCVYIYTEYVKNVIYGIFGVSHFYMAYVWNLGFHTYIWGFSLFMWNTHGICMGYVCVYLHIHGICMECYIWDICGFSLFMWNIHGICVYIYVEYVRNVKYGLYRVSPFYLEYK